MRKFLIALAVMTLTVASFAYAAVQGATVSEISTGQLTETTAGSDVSEGGNVTMMNLTASVSTDRWQGYYGNVTGTLALGYNSDVFYSFAGATALTVFASQNQNFDFTNLNETTGAAIDTAWSYTGGNDLAASIYAGTVDVGGVVTQVATLASGNHVTAIFDDDGGVAKNNYAFGVNVSSAACFDGTTCDYELLVPADAQTGETYYFFVEI